MYIKIISRTVPVRDNPSRYATPICTFHNDFVAEVRQEMIVEDIMWLNITVGWICSRDSSGLLCYAGSTMIEAEKFWTSEADNRRRVASSIGQMLTKSLGLKDLRRVSRTLSSKAKRFVQNSKPFINLPAISMEDLLVSLKSSSGLKPSEIFEFLKIAASQQSNPPKALVDIANDIEQMLSLRPSLWVKHKLNVLVTVDVQSENDFFIMAAARGDLAAVEKCLASGQEVTALHSELQYTALHAAADFGCRDVLERILQTGVSPDIRDARLGRTALHFAAQSGRSAIARLLLEHKADRMIQCFQRMLPYEVADEHGQCECREILKFVPPEIQHSKVDQCTASSITISWTPPITLPHLHSRIDEFIVCHETIDKADNIASHNYRTTDTFITVSHLKPSSGHAFTVYSVSVSGVSNPSSKLIYFTLPSVPDAPPPVELLKVTKNGLVIAWHPPSSDNGGKLDLYQIEMSSESQLIISQSEEAEEEEEEEAYRQQQQCEGIDGSLTPSIRSEQSSDSQRDFIDSLQESSQYSEFTSTSSGTSFTGTKLVDPHEKWHRLIKHRKVNNREKYLMGLEPQRPYYFRVRAHNEFGWSLWSLWAGAFTPQEGVIVETTEVGGPIRLRWVPPQLTMGRCVTAYEVQACQPSGPKTSTVNVYGPKTTSSHTTTSTNNTSIDTSSFDFVTLYNNLKTNEVLVKGLRAGMRYQFRVRPQIDGEWGDWQVMGVTSDVLPIPASAPDSPSDVCIAFGLEDPINSGAIKHDNIMLTWTNAAPNGSPVLEFQIQQALIKEYTTDALSIKQEQNEARRSIFNEQYYGPPSAITSLPDSSSTRKNTLEWEDVTERGKILGPHTFLVRGLMPGNGYVFRVRQRNSIGWSSFSAPSALIQTRIMAPPTPPMTVSVSSYYAILEFESLDTMFEFSALEHEVHVAIVPVTFAGEEISEINNKFEWTFGYIRYIEESSQVMETINGASRNKRVILDKLSPMTSYITRVRVRTVAGWTIWSESSKIFRTLSPP